MSRLTTATDVIDALGGTLAVARLLNVGASAVSNYRRLGFPARAYYKLSLACAQKRLDVAEAVFGGLQSLETAQPLRPPCSVRDFETKCCRYIHNNNNNKN